MRYLKSEEQKILREISVDVEKRGYISDTSYTGEYFFIYASFAEKKAFERDLERFIVDWMEKSERKKKEEE